MTYLLLQTFLLLLSAYFLGAFLACVIKRSMYAGRELEEAAATAAATVAPSQPPVRATIKAEPVAPRSFDPVQPKIDILPRPEPHAVAEAVDTSRFDRALAGKDGPQPVQARPAFAEPAPAVIVDHLAAVLAANAKLPRNMIAEIRPTVLKPVTGPNPKPAPKPEVKPQPAAEVKPAPKPAPVVETKPAPPPVQPAAQQPAAPAQQPAGSAAAIAAAAASAAVAAARAAAAAATGTKPAVAVAPTPAPQPASVAAPAATPAPAAKPQPAPQQPASVVSEQGDDDFLRIRAIDEDVDRRLKALGVRRFDQMARWTAADVNRVNQALGFTDRIDREQWIEQAQILAKGGETYYSRNRAASARTVSAPQPAAPAAPASPRPAVTPAPAPAVQSTPAPATGEPPRPMTPAQAKAIAAAAAAAAAPAATAKPASSAPAPAPSPASAPAAPATAAPSPLKPAPAVASLSAIVDTALSPKPERSVAELAAAAAAAIAAASASVTRGHRPIEPISPLSRVDPNIVIPARLTDAIKENEAKAAQGKADPANPRSVKPDALRGSLDDVEGDDLKRIRGIGVLIEKRLNALGVTRYQEIANWTNADIDRISQQLDFKGRIERENWVEQARILSSGGQTEFSRRVDRGDVESSRDQEDT